MTDRTGFPSNDLRVNGRVSIPRAELDVTASRSGGPGGQHVNTSSTKVEVRWNVWASTALTPEQAERVRAKLGARISTDGILRVVASDSRSQRRNRDVAEARLAELVRGALVVPKPRRKTKRPRSADEARLRGKQQRARRKGDRRWQSDE